MAHDWEGWTTLFSLYLLGSDLQSNKSSDIVDEDKH